MTALTWLESAGFAGGDFALRLTVTLLHFLWQGLAIAVVVYFAGWFLTQASSRARYAVSFAGLLLMAACLPATFAVMTRPQIGAADAGATAPSTLQAEEEPEFTIVNRSTAPFIAETDTSNTSSVVSTVDTLPQSASREPVHTSRTANATGSAAASPLTRYAPLAVAVYFLGVAFMLTRLGLALCGGQRLRKSATPVDDPGILLIVRQQARRIGLKVAPLVCYCERVAVPVVVGVLRPTILLPAALLSGLAPDQLQALFTHELSHIRRLDLVANLVQRLIESLLFFHPAVWYVSRRVSAERENCCDDLVVTSGCDRVQYAGTLIRVAEIYAAISNRSAMPQHAALAVTGTQRSQFNRRVVRLLDGEPRVRPSLGGTFLMLLVLFALSVSTVAALGPNESGAVSQEAADEPPRESALGESAVAEGVDLYGDLLPEGAILRLGTSRLRQPSAVYAVAFSPNGTILASAGSRGVRLWDVATGRNLRNLVDSRLLSVSSLVFSPDGQRLAVAAEGFIQVCDIADGRELFRKGHPGLGEVKCAFFPNGETIASIGGKGDVRLWDLAGGKEKQEFAYAFAEDRLPLAITVSPNGRLVAASAGNAIRIWDVAKGEPQVYIPRPHDSYVTSVAFSTDSRTLISTGNRFVKVGRQRLYDQVKSFSQIRTWNVQTGEFQRELLNDEESNAISVTVPDEASMMVATDTRVLRIDLNSGNVTSTAGILPNNRYHGPNSIAVSPDGSMVAIGTRGTAIELLDSQSGAPAVLIPDAHGGMVRAVDFSPDGTRIATSSSDGTVRLWDVATGRQIRWMEHAAEHDDVRAVAFSPDGMRVAAAGNDTYAGSTENVGVVRIWDAETGEVLQEFEAPYTLSSSMAFSSDGAWLAVALDLKGTRLREMMRREGMIRDRAGPARPVEPAGCPIYVINTHTGQRLRTLEGHTRDVVSLAFAEGDRSLISVGEDKIRTWSLPDGASKSVFESNSGESAAISTDGKFVVISSFEGIRENRHLKLTVRSLSSGMLVRSFEPIPHGNASLAMDISNDGNWLAFGSAKGSFVVLDLATGRQLIKLASPDGHVYPVAFGPSGDRVVTGMDDGTALVWDVSPAER